MKTKTPAHKLPRSVKKSARATVRRKLPRHRRALVHPITVLVLICSGVLITNWTWNVIADSYTVHAKVPAPALTEGAVITLPTAGTVFTNSPINVSGTCPPNSYVKLYHNSVFSGSAWCVAGQTFEIQTSLSPGQNTLMAKDYNITDDPGPDTALVNVTYNVPYQPQVGVNQLQKTSQQTVVNPGSQPGAIGLPLLLTASYTFKAFSSGQDFEWQLNLSGGTAPYTVLINWGDGQSSTVFFKTETVFTISHKYKKAGYYPVKIHAADADGHTADLQIAALIRAPGTYGFNGINHNNSPARKSTGPGFLSWFKQWLWLGWSTYAVVLLLVFSFWLGERQEYLNLARRRYHRNRRPA